MKIVLLFVTPLLMFAKVHYAKVEPYESVVMKSAVSGLVTRVDLDAEGMLLSTKTVIQIDDKLDRLNLRDAKKSIILYKEMLVINQKIANSLQGAFKRKKRAFERMSRISTASQTQKDNAYSAFSSAKTQYLSTREKIITLKKQILDMQYKVASLNESIVKKSLHLEQWYLDKLLVHVGDFVAPGVALAKVSDMRRAKLVLFLEEEEFRDIKTKTIYIDGKKTEYKIDKLWKVADEKYISSYRAEIYMHAPKISFSRLVKVEIR